MFLYRRKPELPVTIEPVKNQGNFFLLIIHIDAD